MFIFSTYAFDLCFMLTQLPNINSGLVDVIIKCTNFEEKNISRIDRKKMNMPDLPKKTENQKNKSTRMKKNILQRIGKNKLQINEFVITS